MDYLLVTVFILAGFVGAVNFVAWLRGLICVTSYQADRLKALEHGQHEISKKFDREIGILRADLAVKTQIVEAQQKTIEILQKDTHEIYECLGMLDERVVSVSEKIKSRASKKHTKNLDQCLNVLHASLSKEVRARRYLQKLVEPHDSEREEQEEQDQSSTPSTVSSKSKNEESDNYFPYSMDAVPM